MTYIALVSSTPLTSDSAAFAVGPWDRRTGTSVGHYHVLSRLGGGAQGVVYLARDTELNRLVALKFFLPRDHQDQEFKDRIVREARAAAAAVHPHICSIYAIGSTSDGEVFIVMPYCAGQTLKHTLQKGRLDVQEAVQIAVEIADALGAAHAEGVVHRDIKPSNLMVTPNGVAILDFGCAQYTDAERVSFAGEFVGTAAYMSPEQSRGERVDARSDVWSTGVVLYEMLTGVAPFEGSHSEALVHAIRHETPAPLSHYVSDIPPELDALVMRALRKDVRERVQSAQALAGALRRVQERTWTMQPAFVARAFGFFDQLRWRWIGMLPARAAMFGRSITTS